MTVVAAGLSRRALLCALGAAPTSNNEFAMPALITPEQAAREKLRGREASRFEIHFPKRFTLWMKALSHLGDGLYFKAIRRTTGL